VIVRARPNPIRCVFCHDDEPAISCPKCDALFHADCREAFGRCATLGCRIRVRVASRWEDAMPWFYTVILTGVIASLALAVVKDLCETFHRM